MIHQDGGNSPSGIRRAHGGRAALIEFGEVEARLLTFPEPVQYCLRRPVARSAPVTDRAQDALLRSSRNVGAWLGLVRLVLPGG